MRRPSLPAADLFTSGNEPDSTPVRDFPEQDMDAQDSAANTQEELEVTNIPEEESFNPNMFVRETGTSEPDGIPAVQEELLPGSIPYEEEEYLPVQNNPVELHLESRGIPDRSGASGSDDPSDEDYIGTDHDCSRMPAAKKPIQLKTFRYLVICKAVYAVSSKPSTVRKTERILAAMARYNMTFLRQKSKR